MGICIGIGNYIGNKKLISINKDPHNNFSNILTEIGSNILTENEFLILREIDYNIITENEESIITENGFYILRDIIEDFQLDYGKLDTNKLK